MQANEKCAVLSLNVRGIRDNVKRRSIFSYLKDQNALFYFLQETFSDINDEALWKNEWGGEIIFSHGSHHSKGVCILIAPSLQLKIDYTYKNNSGRIVLINTTLKSLKLTLCNIYAPNGQSEQLEFIQELNWCLIDKSELTTLIVVGDWNYSLSKKDKTGGAPWKATDYRNLILTTMEMLDLVDIQRAKYPKLRKYSYESKSLGVKSRKDFFFIAKNLEKYVKTCAIVPAIAPDHKAVQISLSWPKETSRGPGFWKFNNTLLTDESYVNTVRSVYAQTCELRSQIEDKRLFWELLKMEIRAATITFAKRKAQMNHNKENEIKRQLDELDNSFPRKSCIPNLKRILS